MFEVGQKVVCVDASPVRPDCAPHMPQGLALNGIYTVRSIQTEPHIPGFGVRLEELRNPKVVWETGEEREWSYLSARFKPLTDTGDQSSSRTEQK